MGTEAITACSTGRCVCASISCRTRASSAFHDALTYEELATLKIFKNSRVLWQTPPDLVAKSGWIYTNESQKLGVYSEKPNGSVKMLKPGNSLREAYIQNHSRPDIIQKRLKEGASANGIGSLKKQIDFSRALGLTRSKMPT